MGLASARDLYQQAARGISRNNHSCSDNHIEVRGQAQVACTVVAVVAAAEAAPDIKQRLYVPRIADVGFREDDIFRLADTGIARWENSRYRRCEKQEDDSIPFVYLVPIVKRHKNNCRIGLKCRSGILPVPHYAELCGRTADNGEV